MPPTTGVIEKGKHRGWLWEVFEDPDSPSGWTRKIWNPRDRSAGGKPKEFFDDEFEYPKQLRRAQDAQRTSQSARAEQAAREARYSGILERDVENRREAGRLTLQQQEAERTESRRRFDTTSDYNERTRKDAIKRAKEALREQIRQFDLTHGLEERKLGADILKTGASMRGPLDAFQGFAYAQGVADSDLAPYVRAVYGGDGPAYGGGTGTQGSPTPLTVGTLANEMARGGSTGLDAYGRPKLRPDQEAKLAPIREAYEGGLANKGLGYMERMTPNQLKAFLGGGDFIGRDTDSEVTYYQRSRPGQRSAALG